MKNIINNKLKKVVSLSFALLVALQPYSAYALTKEETVYSKLDSNGNIKTILVNDYLKNIDSLQELEDYSDLDNITNLSGNEIYSINDGRLIWQANGNNILYQGTTTKTLPVKEKISYKLNGDNIDIKDLIGKNGHVEITITYENNDLHKVNVNGKMESLYTPFVVTTAMTISNEHISNLEVINGKVVDNGNNYMIAGVSAPGLYESLKIDSLKGLNNVIITYDTDKFELSSIYSVIIPKLIDSEDLTIFEKMDEMYSDVDKLQENMDVLENSAKVISENLNTVSESTNLVYESLNTVLSNMGELKKGTADLDVGLKTLLDNLTCAKDGINSDEMSDKIETMKEIIKNDKLQIQNITTKNQELKTNYDKYNLQNMTYEQILSINNMDLYNLKYTYEQFYESNNNLVSLLTYNASALEETLNSITEISNSVDTMINTISEYMTKLSNGATQINQGVNKLEMGVSLLTENVGKLNLGMKELSNGAFEFKNGMSKYNKEGINELTNKKNIANTITKKINSLMKLADNYNTFTKFSNNNENSTKFIYVVDAIKVKEDKIVVEKNTKNETFLDRLKNLFK